MSAATRPIAILIAALGGEGGGVLAEWLVTAAARAGYPAQGTSIPGVAQRTGSTTYYVEVFPEPIATLGGRAPVLGLVPIPGRVDLVVASELLEAARTVQAGLTSPDRTVLVTSTSRTLTTAEKLPLGDGRYDAERLLDVARAYCRRVVAFDMPALAREEGTVVSAVMFGAIAASGVLPFGRDACAAVIEGDDRAARASRAGFERACEPVPGCNPVPVGALSVDEVVALGHARVVEFQDRAYGRLYRERVDRIRAAEAAADLAGVHAGELTRESARFLALWMAFDDVVRVADLKCRASRFARVRREVAAGDGDVVRIVDYFKPGVAEIAGLLPSALAKRLAASDRRRQARGKPPFGLALALPTDTVRGFVALRLLSSLRRLRRHGTRFAEEQAAIAGWLGAIETAAREDWRLAHEIALCGRLVKGYGATIVRGKENLRHILAHLAAPAAEGDAATRAAAIRAAREAALADEAGKALDATLAAHGAPPRPVRAQPVRWIKARSATVKARDAAA